MILRQKNHIFSNFRGGGGALGAPPLDLAPVDWACSSIWWRPRRPVWKYTVQCMVLHVSVLSVWILFNVFQRSRLFNQVCYVQQVSSFRLFPVCIKTPNKHVLGKHYNLPWKYVLSELEYWNNLLFPLLMPFLPYWIYRNINSQWKNVYVRNLSFNVTLKDVSIM